MVASVVELSDHHDVGRELSHIVGANLRRLRTRQGHSLERLAQVSGVSRAMLSQIENGKSAPTIALLWKVATALGVPFATLIATGQPDGSVVLRRDDAKILASSDGRFTSRALFPYDSERRVEFYELRLAANHTELAEPHAPGTTENLIVTQGAVEVLVGRETPKLLGEGDAILFQADVAHRYRNMRSVEAVLYLVMTYVNPVTG
ncbi:XRE family transcriptional regulator [Devosia sp. 2618]|uniref:helix-turn-helix domain-containing protein n=1 Tax=Devosia sp. 2618 TaxID=3156454 RepID=UPI00339A249C